MRFGRNRNSSMKELDLDRFARPQGAPRGFLVHYILFRIALKPAHGYELIQDIEEGTRGAWRPGAGSIYPLLKKLASHGLIEPAKNLETGQIVYQVTEKGKLHVQKAREVFSESSEKWVTMRRIFVQMLEPKDLSKFFVDGTKMHLEITREVMESKLDGVSFSEAEFILKEYSLNLERQLDWASTLLKKVQRSHAVATAPALRKQ